MSGKVEPVPPSDAELIQAVLNGDGSAYAELYDRHARWVRAIAFDTTKDLDEAQDLAQEAFLRAYHNLRSLREPERFGAWLHTIIHTICLEWLRRHAREPDTNADAVLELRPGPLPLSNDETIEQVREAIASLPEREREAVHVFYLLEQSAEEAGTVLNLSRSGLYRLLGRARQRLGRLLRSEWENVP